MVRTSDDEHPVRPALCICTYCREETVLEKVGRLKDLIDIFVVDNGSTLPDIEGVHIVRSPNYGGSSGFARALAEAYHSGPYTHFILNDDDALVEPEVIRRTVEYLSEHEGEYCICGTMLDQDDPDIVVESGSRFRGCEILPMFAGRDIGTITDREFEECSKDIDYGGWWYYVVPRSVVRRVGLPLPLFIKNDDVEYGCRIDVPQISVRGIQAHHRNFVTKYNPVNYYYYIRNLLTIGFTGGRFDRDLVREVFQKIHLETACLRYEDAELMLEGAEDFLKGPDHVFHLCTEGMKEIVDKQEYVSVPDMPDFTPAEGGFRFRKYTLNGALLPSKGVARRRVDDMHTEDFYRLGKVYYVIDGTKGFVADRRTARSISLTLRTILLQRKVLAHFDRLSEEYREAGKRYSGIGSWNELWGTDYPDF